MSAGLTTIGPCNLQMSSNILSLNDNTLNILSTLKPPPACLRCYSVPAPSGAGSLRNRGKEALCTGVTPGQMHRRRNMEGILKAEN